MGVQNLWKALAKGDAVQSFDGSKPGEHAAIVEAVEHKVVAVDLSAWLMQVGAREQRSGWRAVSCCGVLPAAAAPAAAPSCCKAVRSLRELEGTLSCNRRRRCVRPTTRVGTGPDAARAAGALRLCLCTRSEGRV
jgi:hypothetical protein